MDPILIDERVGEGALEEGRRLEKKWGRKDGKILREAVSLALPFLAACALQLG
jgi:hypothetical protein